MAHRVRFHPPVRAEADGPWDPEQALEKAIAERDAFLRKHPRLNAYQQHIDKVLEGAGSAENRMTVLCLMIEAKLHELREHLQRLSRLLTPVLGPS